jgi:molybdate transport system substrate-binding protein
MKAALRVMTSAAALCLGALISCGSVTAAELTLVSTAGPLPEVLGALTPMFEKASGHKVKLSVKAAPAIVKDVKDGAAIDLIIANAEPVDELVKDGSIGAAGSARVWLSRVGVAVRAGAPKPDIGTTDAFKAALVAAKSVAYSQGSSGQHFLTVVARLGLVEVIKSKAIITQGRPVGAAVASGEAEIGVQQVAELLPVAGITFVGPLPGDLQKIIAYSAGVPAKAKEADAAKAFVKFLSSEAAVSVVKKMGMDPAQ